MIKVNYTGYLFPWTLERKAGSFKVKDNLGNQTVEFSNPTRSVYDMTLDVFDHKKCVVELKGRVVDNVIFSILNNGSKELLIAIREGINERLEEKWDTK